ncbi:COG1361 family protein [Xylanivirga thermophila]|uniref:hypothetical protein n=1 Tax=Xylanivirga thermophila TaxID=2496273 RepID=UPI00101D13FA|nr:hypothetical protein [Xylanivirga thermophila]
MRCRFISILLSIMLLSCTLVNGIAIAEGNVEVNGKLEGNGISYTIKNNLEEDITGIEIEEILIDKDGNKQQSFIQGDSIAPGQTKNLRGNDYSGTKGPLTIKYIVRYTTSSNGEMRVAGEGEKKLNIGEVRLNVTYQANPSSGIKKGDKITYTATIESKSDMVVNNIMVQDSSLGDMGTIPSLAPNESKTISKEFVVNDDMESYIILGFVDPFSGKQVTREMKKTKVKVKVQKEEVKNLNPKISISGKADKASIKDAQEVTFTFTISNTGDDVLKNIKCIDWDGETFFNAERLDVGQQISAKLKKQVQPGVSYSIRCAGTAEQDGRTVEAAYSTKFSSAVAQVEIDRKITPDQVNIGDTVRIEYIIRNTGTVSLLNIKLNENVWGEVGGLTKLQPGEEKVIVTEKKLEKNFISSPVLTATNGNTGDEYEYTAADMIIPVEGSEVNEAHISISVLAKPETLEKPGTVELECTIRNENDIPIKNVEIILKERDLVLGSFVEIGAGEQQIVKSPPIEVDQTEKFTVILKAKDTMGGAIEVSAKPINITIGKDSNKLDEKDPYGKAVLLKNILIVIILLTIFAVGMLIYVLKMPHSKFNKNKRRRRRY